MKKIIIAFILGVAITFVGVKATNILIPSTSVAYDKDGETVTVNDALNNLFNMSNSEGIDYMFVGVTGHATWSTNSDVQIPNTKYKSKYIKGNAISISSNGEYTILESGNYNILYITGHGPNSDGSGNKSKIRILVNDVEYASFTETTEGYEFKAYLNIPLSSGDILKFTAKTVAGQWFDHTIVIYK